MNQYADYKFYTSIFGGISIEADKFDSIMLKASAFIDEITFGRVEEVTDDIRLAACAVAEEMFSAEQARAASGNGAISSEKTGDESISYNTGASSVYSSEAYRKYYGIAAMFIRDKRLLERWRMH